MSDELFIEDDEAEPGSGGVQSWKIIIVDDDPSVHQVTRYALADIKVFDRPLTLLSAFSAEEALQLIKNEADLAMGFIDVVMESEHAGLDLIKQIRNELHNHTIRLVLRTGQPGIASEVEVTRDYDIHQYTEKSQLTSARLTSVVYTAIRAYSDINFLNQRTEELIEALEKASISEKAKNEFLARMSHELKTPMNAVLGYTQLLQSSDLEPKQQQNLSKVVASGTTLLKMLNDILDFSNLDLGTLSIEPELFQIKNLSEAFIHQFAEIADRKALNLNVTIGKSVPEQITGDWQRIEQILNYLGDNATKFSEEGDSVSLDIDVETRDGLNQLLVFSISDTGIGISLGQQKMLFRLFAQLDGSVTRKYCGIGIGLIIAKKLSELMGGKITVESTPGVGSCFKLKIPLLLED